jgi:hypothetical protein
MSILRIPAKERCKVLPKMWCIHNRDTNHTSENSLPIVSAGKSAWRKVL